MSRPPQRPTRSRPNSSQGEIDFHVVARLSRSADEAYLHRPTGERDLSISLIEWNDHPRQLLDSR